MITIGIIDRDQEGRERLVSILESAAPDPIIGDKPDLFVNFARETFNPAAIHPEESHPDIILIDMEGQPAESIRSIKAAFPEAQVVVVSDCIETAVALRAYRAGATNYVQKSTAEHFLYYAIMSTMISSSRDDVGESPQRIRS
jgi:DNA-binding NarL/FixJ family response regulator